MSTDYSFKHEIRNRPSTVVGQTLQTIREEKDGRRTLTRDFVVRVGKEEIRVEKGFDTDFSSIPRTLLIWVFFLPRKRNSGQTVEAQRRGNPS